MEWLRMDERSMAKVKLSTASNGEPAAPWKCYDRTVPEKPGTAARRRSMVKHRVAAAKPGEAQQRDGKEMQRMDTLRQRIAKSRMGRDWQCRGKRRGGNGWRW